MSATSSPLSEPPLKSPRRTPASSSPSSSFTESSESQSQSDSQESVERSVKSQETKAKKRPRMIESSDEDDEDEQKKQKKAEPKAAMNASAKSQISSRQPSAQSTPQHLQSKSTTKQAKNNVKVTTTTKMAATGKPERKVEQPVVTNEKETHRKKAGEAENAKERGTQQEKRVKKERELKEKQRGTERAKEENTTKASVKELETDPAEMKEENLKAKDEEKDKRVEVTPHTTPKKEMDKVQERKERHARQLQEKQQRDKERQAKADALKADRQERAELKTGTDKKAKADDEDTAMEVDALPTPHKAKPKADPPKHPTATATKKEIPSFKKHKSTTNSPSTSGNATPNHFNLNDLFKLSESGVDVKASQAAKREKEEKARGEDREMRRRKEDYMRQLDHMLENSTMHSFMDDREMMSEWEKSFAPHTVPYPYANFMGMYGIDWFKLGPAGFSREVIEQYNRENPI